MSNAFETIAQPGQCIITECWRDTAVTVSCAGELDMSTAPELEQRITSVVLSNPTSIIVDLTPLRFLASHGIAALVAGHELCSPTIRFAVVAQARAIHRPLQLLGITNVSPVHATLEEAIEAVAT